MQDLSLSAARLGIHWACGFTLCCFLFWGLVASAFWISKSRWSSCQPGAARVVTVARFLALVWMEGPPRYPRDPSIHTIPTLGPTVCEWCLRWAIWIPKDVVSNSSRGLGSSETGQLFLSELRPVLVSPKALPVWSVQHQKANVNL